MDATRKGAGIGGASVAWGRPASTRMGLARGVSSSGAGLGGRSETRLEKWSGMVYSGSSLAGTVGQSMVVSARSHRGTCRGGSRLLREGPLAGGHAVRRHESQRRWPGSRRRLGRRQWHLGGASEVRGCRWPGEDAACRTAILASRRWNLTGEEGAREQPVVGGRERLVLVSVPASPDAVARQPGLLPATVRQPGSPADAVAGCRQRRVRPSHWRRFLLPVPGTWPAPSGRRQHAAAMAVLESLAPAGRGRGPQRAAACPPLSAWRAAIRQPSFPYPRPLCRLRARDWSCVAGATGTRMTYSPDLRNDYGGNT